MGLSCGKTVKDISPVVLIDRCICGRINDKSKDPKCEKCNIRLVHTDEIRLYEGCEYCMRDVFYMVGICCECQSNSRLRENMAHSSLPLPIKLANEVMVYDQSLYELKRVRCRFRDCGLLICHGHSILCQDKFCNKRICIQHTVKCTLCLAIFCEDCFNAHEVSPICECKVPQCMRISISCQFCQRNDRTHLLTVYTTPINVMDKCCSTTISICCLCAIRYPLRYKKNSYHNFVHKVCSCGIYMCKDSTALCDICLNNIAHTKWDLSEGKLFERDKQTRNFVNVCCKCEIRNDIMIMNIEKLDKVIVSFYFKNQLKFHGQFLFK